MHVHCEACSPHLKISAPLSGTLLNIGEPASVEGSQHVGMLLTL